MKKKYESIEFELIPIAINDVISTSGQITPPENESNEYYGGDAYTGIQQAAAQGANNLIPVFKAIEENNRAIGILNDNLIKQNANAVSNQEIQSVTDADNLRSVAFLVRDCFGYLILALGLFTVADRDNCCHIYVLPAEESAKFMWLKTEGGV